MDFANERYVRFYTRNTTGWKLLRWEGRSVWSMLYREADRAGVIGLDGIEPWEAAVLHCEFPEEVAKVGMQRCLKHGWIVHDGDRLVFPKYIEANETAMSDKQRAKESRAKRAALGATSQNVTLGSQNVMPASRSVTSSHTTSHDVTPRHSTPSRAVLNQAEPSGDRAHAHEEQSSDHWADGWLEESIRIGFQQRYENAVKSAPIPGQVTKMSAKVKLWVEQTARLRNAPEDQIARQLLDAFFASDSAREKGFPPAFLAANPLEYFEPRKRAGPDLAVVRSRVSTLDEALNNARRKLAQLDPEDPDYRSKLYDAEREEREAEEARDRAKRKLAAAVGGE